MGRSGLGEITLHTLTQGNSSKTVVLKTLYQHKDFQKRQQVLRRFEREWGLWSGACHPNVAPLLGIWQSPAQMMDPLAIPSYVNPLYQHGDIASFADRCWDKSRHRIPTELYPLLRGFLDGLCYLHSRGVVHADLQPSNVMIDEYSEPRILDFGFSKFKDLHGSSSASEIQVSRYAAPEAETHHETTHSSSEGISRGKGSQRGDVWAFGMVVLRVISGQVPYADHRNENELRDCLTSGEPVEQIREYYPRMPDTMWNLLQAKCWNWRPRDRKDIWEIRVDKVIWEELQRQSRNT